MPEYSFDIVPLSRLFMKDARPMTGSDAGQGAQWPRPDHVWHAIFHAFHTAWPEIQKNWEHKHLFNEKDDHRNSSFRFGALKTAGPFPRNKDGILYFPTPLDWNYRLVYGEGTDLPTPLKYAFQNRIVGKTNPPRWISEADYETYLNGNEKTDFPKDPELKLYGAERDIGIALKDDTGTTEEGKLYQAEYIRLQEGVKLAIEASCDVFNGYTKQTTDLFEKLGVPFYTVLGGQQGISLVEGRIGKLNIPSPQINSRYLRWTLLSPAVFPKIDAGPDKRFNPHPGGWLPSWIDPDTGKVLLTNEVPPRGERESREAYRARVRNEGQIQAKLIAARIGSPLAFSGWDVQDTAPKSTVLAVPSGSCYVFDCDSTENAQALAKALKWPKRRSTLFGERGFGMGICSSYPENRI